MLSYVYFPQKKYITTYHLVVIQFISARSIDECYINFYSIKEARLAEVANAMKDPVKGIKLKDKRYFLKAYAKCFTGKLTSNNITTEFKGAKHCTSKFFHTILKFYKTKTKNKNKKE
jgi:hypothetical protein